MVVHRRKYIWKYEEVLDDLEKKAILKSSSFFCKIYLQNLWKTEKYYFIEDGYKIFWKGKN